MNTRPQVSTHRLSGDQPADIARAVDILKTGGLVALPTETVYGLGAVAANDQAVARIFAAKGRPADHPLIVHIASAEELSQWARDVPETARKLAEAFWPGPLTMILKRAPGAAKAASGGLDTIGLRVPGHPVALALLKTLGGGIAAPSANRYGRISPTCADHVLAELDGHIEAVIDGGQCSVGLESTIVDLSGLCPRILRPGAVTTSMLAAVVGSLNETTATAAAPKAPGSLEAHYAPVTPLRLVNSQALEAEVANFAKDGGVVVLASREPVVRTCSHWIRLPNDAVAYGHDLYARLLESDMLGAVCILVEKPPEDAEWLAVNDRLKRAAVGSGGGFLLVWHSVGCRYNRAYNNLTMPMENKTARLTILIDPAKKKAFERLCAEQDLTPSQVVRQMIREYLAQHGVQYGATSAPISPDHS